MKDFLYKQKDVLALLHKNKVATFKKASFSEAVRRGQIPFHYEEGIKTKLYKYDEVVKAIKKAGIGNSDRLSKKQSFDDTVKKLDALPEPKSGQTANDYAEEVTLPSDISTITDANLYKIIYQGKLEKIKYEKAMDELIERKAVEDKSFAIARIIRDKLLSIPERLSNELATIDDPYVIKEMLYSEINLILEDLSTVSLYE